MKKLRMVGGHYHFYFIKIFCIEITYFSLQVPPFFSIFDNILLKIHNKMFRVEAKT